jgi:hypothetical protein
MSAQQPTAPSQPPKSAAFQADDETTKKPSLQRVPSEYAVADTPGTSGPYGSGGDYWSYRKAPSPTPGSSDGGGLRTSQGYGIHGTDPKDYHSTTSQEGGRRQHPLQQNMTADDEEQDQEKMAPATEGKVADAVERKSGTQQWHGRARGEVSIAGDEADLER